MRVESFKKAMSKKEVREGWMKKGKLTRVHVDLKAESEKLSKAVCGEPELELPVRVVPGTVLAYGSQ